MVNTLGVGLLRILLGESVLALGKGERITYTELLAVLFSKSKTI